MMLYVQNLVLNLSPGLIPLFVLPLSLVQSWHCLFMCSPFQVKSSKSNPSSFLQGRILGYALMGSLSGYFGEKLFHQLGYQALGVIAYFVFLFLTLFLFFLWFSNFDMKRSKKNCTLNQGLVSNDTSALNQGLVSNDTSALNPGQKFGASFAQGLLMTFIPCPVLFQVFSLSALTGSSIGGLLTGLAHGVITTPTLWWGQNGIYRLLKFKKFSLFVKLVLSSILILNLFYFSGRWLNPKDKNLKSKILFCF